MIHMTRGPRHSSGLRRFLSVVATGAVLVTVATTAVPRETQAQDTGRDEGIFRHIPETLDYSVRVLAFGIYQDPAESTLNPENVFLELPDREAGVEIRPDVSLSLDRLWLSAKPRVRGTLTRRSRDGRAAEDDTAWDWFVNEWLSRVELSDTLFVSYGRENLQWGPSYLLSPSNPFFADNGRRNPKQEVPGMDFARLVWVPDESWTVSLIANTGEGRQPVPADLFHRTYALKVDYAGRESYESLVLSRREGDRTRLGVFGGRTLTDALLVYGEGTLSRGTEALYPFEDNGILGGTMRPLKDADTSLAATILLGGSYTLETGPTVSLEYVYNSPGYGDGDAERFYHLRARAAEAFTGPGPAAAQAAPVLARASDTGLRLLRRHYLMLQYNHTDIMDVFDLTVRATRNLDDHSNRLTAIAEYFAGDHLSFFSIGTVNGGGGDTEFGSLLDLQWMVGFEYAF